MTANVRISILVATLLVASDSHAQLINGGFETGDFAGWTVGGNAASGVDPDGTAISGTGYADNVVNVRSGSHAAWGAVNYDFPAISLTLTQTIPVDELRVYDVGFWQSVGRTSGTGGAGARHDVTVDGEGLFPFQQYTVPAGNDSSAHLHKSALYATSAGQTTATVTFTVLGYAGGTVGISYDDFHFDLTPACGDGVLHPTEQCDDGNVADGDCCSSLCQNANEALACDDGLYCTDGDTCTAGVCVASPRDCDDANLCTNDVCYESLDECRNEEEPAEPSACFQAASVKVKVSDSVDPSNDKFSWVWKLGDTFDQADVASPTMTTTYAVCLYDKTYEVPLFEVSEAKIDIQIPPSATQWTERDPRGASYKDKDGTFGGLKKLSLKTGTDGRTMVKVSASGANLSLPEPFSEDAYFAHQLEPVVVELRNSEGTCWYAAFQLEHVLKSSNEGYSARFK